MKKLVKFTTKEIVRVVEKEIELPAYFCIGSLLPSSVGKGEYFHPVVRIDNPDSRGCMISASMMGYKGYAGLSFGISPYESGEIIEHGTQVPESEWLAAVAMLKADIDGVVELEQDGMATPLPSLRSEQQLKQLITNINQ